MARLEKTRLLRKAGVCSWAAALFFLINVAGQAVAQSDQGTVGMAKDEIAGNILLTPAIADAKKPGILTVNLSKNSNSPRARLELSVSPEKTSANEGYVVVVSPVGEPDKQLGSFAFFPPPRTGEIRKFYIDVPTDATVKNWQDGSKVNLSVELVPIDQNAAFTSSSVKILGARVVGGQ